MPAQTDHHVGGTKHFECRVKGHPRPEIRWFKDGKEITHIPRYKFDYSHEGIISMVIPDITHDDEGHYRCRAENSEGMASTSAYLFVRAHKEHPEEAITSIHSMEIEEAVVFTEKEKKAKRESKANGKEPHFETPIEDVDTDHSKERRLSKEEEEIVRKSFESVIESSTTTRSISSSSTTTTTTTTTTKTTTSKSEKDVSEQESTKISVDQSEKSYHSSEESSDDLDSVRLKTISERSETTSLLESVGDLDEDEQDRSLLMRQTKRIFSQDYDSDSDLFKLDASSMMEKSASKMKMTSSSTSESLASGKSESVSMTAESSVSKMETSESKSGKVTTTEIEMKSSSAAVSVGHGDDAGDESKKMISSSSISESTSIKRDGVLVEETKSSAKTVEESGLKGKSAQISDGGDDSSKDSASKSSKVSKKDGERSDLSSLQDDSGFLEASSILETSKTDDSLLLSSQSEISATGTGNESGKKIRTETEIDESSRKSKDDENKLKAVSESELAAEKSSRRLEAIGDSEAGKAAEKKAMELEEEEFESVTESETDGSVGSVVGVDVETSAKLRKQESKERDEAEEEELANRRGAGDAGKGTDTQDGARKDGVVVADGDGKKTAGDDIAVAKKDKDETRSQKKGDDDGDDTDAKRRADKDKLSADDVDGRGTGRDDERKSSKDDQGDKKDDGSLGQGRDRRRGSQPEDEMTRDEAMETRTSWVEKVEAMEDKEKKKVADEALEKGGDKKEKDGDRKEKVAEEETVPQVKPKIVQKMEDVKVEAGKALKLRTQVQASPQPEVTWSRDGQALREGERITLVTDNDVYSLEIAEVQESDSGTYRLTAVNSAGEIFSDVLVNVTSSMASDLAPGQAELSMTASIGIPEFVIRPQDVSVPEFETIKLTCSVKGDPAPKVSWEKDGKVIRSNRRVRVFESRGVYNLEIHDCEDGDAGQYVCVAVNSQGRTEATINVMIEGVESTTSITGEAEPEGVTGQPVDEVTEGAVGGAVESSSDVCNSDTRTVRYLKLIGMAAAFSLAAFGVKKVLDNINK